MKNISLLELIVIGIAILAGCFAISKFVLSSYNMQTDFLSASATFFAAIVALKLFNDWKLQYRTELLERLKDRIHSQFILLETEYDLLFDTYLLRENTTEIKIHQMVVRVNQVIDNIITELEFYEKILIKYDLDSNLMVLAPHIVKQELMAIVDGLTINAVEESDNDGYIRELGNYLNSHVAYDTIIKRKAKVNSDLQKIILDLISLQKGH